MPTKAGRLPAKKLENGQWSIDTADLDRLYRLRGAPLPSSRQGSRAPDIPPDAPPDVLLMEVRDLLREVRDLLRLQKRQRQLPVAPVGSAEPPVTSLSAPLQARTRHIETPGPIYIPDVLDDASQLPEGSILALHFARNHQVPDTLTKYCMTTGAIQHVAIPQNSGSTRLWRFITPELMPKAIAGFVASGIYYTPCPDCPHGADLTTLKGELADGTE